MQEILKRLSLSESNPGVCTGNEWLPGGGGILVSVSPIDGHIIGKVQKASPADLEWVIGRATEAFREWRMTPAPRRGEIVRQIGNTLRQYKEDLSTLVILETGKIRSEAEAEVQEMIDICDFAVGQSRMLYGLTMPSERPRHRMYEQWHPLGPIGGDNGIQLPLGGMVLEYHDRNGSRGYRDLEAVKQDPFVCHRRNATRRSGVG